MMAGTQVVVIGVRAGKVWCGAQRLPEGIRRHTRAERGDASDHLMTRGHPRIAEVAAPDVQVGAADAGHAHLGEHGARLRSGGLKFLNLKRISRIGEGNDSSTHPATSRRWLWR